MEDEGELYGDGGHLTDYGARMISSLMRMNTNEHCSRRIVRWNEQQITPDFHFGVNAADEA